MNTVKRIMAIVGIVILAGLYITTLVLAIIGGESTKQWFTASIVATVVIPVMIYVYQWLYKLVKKQAADARNPETMIVNNQEKEESDN